MCTHLTCISNYIVEMCKCIEKGVLHIPLSEFSVKEWPPSEKWMVLNNFVLSKWEFYMVFRTFHCFSNLIKLYNSMVHKCLSTQLCDAIQPKWFMQSSCPRFTWKNFCLVILEQVLKIQICLIKVKTIYSF